MLKWFSQPTKMANQWVKCSVYAGLLFAEACFIGCSTGSEKNKPFVDTTARTAPYNVYTVEIKDMKFVPDVVRVNKGDEIVFVNRDMVVHCVTEEKGKAWTSGPLAAGASYLLVVKDSADYYCAIHQVMKGKIIIK